MPVAIGTGTGIAVDRTQNGVHWAALNNGGTAEFWRASDAATFADSGDDLTVITAYDLFVDLDDFAHFVYVASGGVLRYRRGTPNAGRTQWTWSAPVDIYTDSNWYAAKVVAHREGSGWRAHVAFTSWPGSGQVVLRWAQIPIVGSTPTLGPITAVANVGAFGFGADVLALDFQHTGDGKTVQGSPHLFFAYSDGATQTVLHKAVHSSGTWTLASPRVIDTDDSTYVAGRFNGSSETVAYVLSSADTVVVVKERDAADTVTTTLAAPPALSDGAITGLAVTYDTSANLYLFAVGTTSDDVKRVRYDRALGTWGAWTTVEATTATASTLRARRGYAGRRVDALYTVSGAARFDSLYVNAAPSAPSWNTASGVANVNAALVPDWNHEDPDVGDTQTAYALERTVGAVTRYWRASDSTWQNNEVKNVSSATAVTLASGWGADSDASHVYKVKTWDNSDVASPYSAALTITPSAKVNPVVTAPGEGATITAATTTVTWTAAEQTAYRARILSDADVELWSSGWIIDSGTRSIAVPYVHADSTTFKAAVTTKNVEGLESNEDTNTYTTDFTPPPMPTLAVSVFQAGGRDAGLRVAIANPTPSGGEPALGRNDLYRREVGAAGDGWLAGPDLAEDAVYDDYEVESQVAYEYRAAAWGDNGTVTHSAWVS